MCVSTLVCECVCTYMDALSPFVCTACRGLYWGCVFFFSGVCFVSHCSTTYLHVLLLRTYFRMALQRPWENYIRIIFKLPGKVRWHTHTHTLAMLALGRQRKEDGCGSRRASGA